MPELSSSSALRVTTTRRSMLGLPLGLASGGTRAEARALRVVGAPFARIYEPHGGAARGLAVDLLARALPGRALRYEFLPWPRAQAMVESGEADLLVGPYRTPEREERFLFSRRPFYEDAMVWFTRRGETTRWSGDFSGLQGQGLAAVQGWAYGAQFEHLRHRLQRLTWVKDVERGLRMLQLRRVDLFATNERNTYPVAEQLGFQAQLEVALPPLDLLSGHMAFPRNAAGEALRLRYDEGFERLLASRQFEHMTRDAGLQQRSERGLIRP